MLDRHPLKRSPGSLRDAEEQIRTVCQECGVACGLLAGVAAGRIVDVQGDESHPVSRGTLCARGTAFVQGLTAPERLALCGSPQPLETWKSGMDKAGERLRQIRERHGPDSLLVCCDREGGLDFHLAALRFARLFGTSKVVGPTPPLLDPWPEGLDSPAAPCTEWVRSGTLLLVESDLAATHPVAFGWVQEAQRRGAQVVAADARFTATMAKANLALRIRPGQGNALGLALAKLALQGAPGDGALEGAFTDAARCRASFEQLSLDGAEDALGLPVEKVEGLHRLLAAQGPVTIITGRALAARPHHRVWLTLAAAVGADGRGGGGWYPVDSGAPPLALPGDARVAASGLEPAPVAEERQPKAVICSGDALTDYLARSGRNAAELELVVHFGAFPNASWVNATVSFPAALWPERDGIAFGDDRSVHWAPKLVAAPAGSRTGLEFWTELARRFGWEKEFPWVAEDGQPDHAALYDAVLAGSEPTVAIRVQALRDVPAGERLSWSRPAAAELPAFIAPASLTTPGSGVGADYPLTLVASDSSCRSGDASRYWEWTRDLAREDAIDIHPDTAVGLRIANGDEIVVGTPRGDWPARARLSRAVPPGLVASLRGVGGLPLPARVHRADRIPHEAPDHLKASNP